MFFPDQKTAYEIYHGLVGSEMCIRDRCIHTEDSGKLVVLDWES